MPGRPDIIACPSQEPALSARPDMNTITGRFAFLALLEDEGVTHLFGNPGTTELPIMDALPEYPGLRYVLGLQEGVVLSMVGRLRPAPRGVSPRATCTSRRDSGTPWTPLYNAKWCGSPVLVTAGQQEQGHGLTEPLLYGPLVEMAVKRRSILTPDRSAFSPPLTCEGARSSYRRRGRIRTPKPGVRVSQMVYSSSRGRSRAIATSVRRMCSLPAIVQPSSTAPTASAASRTRGRNRTVQRPCPDSARGCVAMRIPTATAGVPSNGDSYRNPIGGATYSSQRRLQICSVIAPAKALVETSLAPSIRRAKSKATTLRLTTSR